MHRYRVGVANHDEIFWRGAAICLAEDHFFDVTRIGIDLATPDIDVAVISVDMAEFAWDCPTVICLTRSNEAPSCTALDQASAVLNRRLATPEQLVGAVRAAASGLRVTVGDRDNQDLDDRKLEIIQLLAQGASTRDISDHLSFSERTIKSVIHEIQEALGAKNRAHVVAEALRRQLI